MVSTYVSIVSLLVMEEDDYCGQGCEKKLTEFVMKLHAPYGRPPYSLRGLGDPLDPQGL